MVVRFKQRFVSAPHRNLLRSRLRVRQVEHFARVASSDRFFKNFCGAYR